MTYTTIIVSTSYPTPYWHHHPSHRLAFGFQAISFANCERGNTTIVNLTSHTRTHLWSPVLKTIHKGWEWPRPPRSCTSVQTMNRMLTTINNLSFPVTCPLGTAHSCNNIPVIQDQEVIKEVLLWAHTLYLHLKLHQGNTNAWPGFKLCIAKTRVVYVTRGGQFG